MRASRAAPAARLLRLRHSPHDARHTFLLGSSFMGSAALTQNQWYVFLHLQHAIPSGGSSEPTSHAPSLTRTHFVPYALHASHTAPRTS